MYNGFFGFKEKPFKLIPNPDFLFLGKSHEEALAHLAYAISQGDGFVEITGEVGAGKTTLCRAFLEDLDKNIEVAFIFNSKLNSLQLLNAIHSELGIDSSSSDIVDLTHSLNQFLLKKKSDGKSVIILIDEAQHLGKETLEQLRLLSNLETTKSKLLQIILVGQPELNEILDAFDLRQLRQRINLSCHILPLSLVETQNYISHRINIASRKAQDLFTLKAKKIIYNYSNGIPRRINIICDRSLIAAYSLNKKRISANIANIAAKELHGYQHHPPEAQRNNKLALWPLLLVIISLLILLLAFSHVPSKWILNTQQSTVSNTKTLNSKIPIQPTKNIVVETIKKPDQLILEESTLTLPTSISVAEPSNRKPSILLLKSIKHNMDRKTALYHILSLWSSQPSSVPVNSIDQIGKDPDFFRMAALQNNFLMLHAEPWENWLEKFNLPAILKLIPNNHLEAKYIVVNKITNNNEYVFSFQDEKKIFKIAKKDLYPLITGDAFIACKNIFGHTRVISKGSPKFSVLSVKLILRQIGFTSIELTPIYDDPVKKAVKQIQAKYGLIEDGMVGPMTKLAFIQEKNELSTPFLKRQVMSATKKGITK